jgi:hypothetical protein
MKPSYGPTKESKEKVWSFRTSWIELFDSRSLTPSHQLKSNRRSEDVYSLASPMQRYMASTTKRLSS